MPVENISESGYWIVSGYIAFMIFMMTIGKRML